MLAFLTAVTSGSDREDVSYMHSTLTTLYVLMFILALYLAFKDSKAANPGMGKCCYVLALLSPEVYIALHCMMTARSGQSFFSGVSHDLCS